MKKLTSILLFLFCSTALFGQQNLTLSPTSGQAAGGTTVRINGHLGLCPVFPPCNAPTVRFGSTAPITATELANDRISVVTPVHAPGVVDVIITNRAGLTITLPSAFTFLQEGNPVAGWERILIPVAVKQLSGNFGSLWTSDISVVNAGSTPVQIEDCIVEACSYTPAPTAPLHPGVAKSLDYRYLFNEPAAILWVRTAAVDQLRFAARFRDLSKQAESYGNELPIVRERDLTAGPVHILDIPTDRDFRVTLRLYDIDDRRDNQVEIRVFAMNGEETLFLGAPVTLTRSTEQPGEFYGFAAISLDQLLATSRFPFVRVEARATNPATRLWGFATVTSNTTQQVTVISQQ